MSRLSAHHSLPCSSYHSLSFSQSRSPLSSSPPAVSSSLLAASSRLPVVSSSLLAASTNPPVVSFSSHASSCRDPSHQFPILLQSSVVVFEISNLCQSISLSVMGFNSLSLSLELRFLCLEFKSKESYVPVSLHRELKILALPIHWHGLFSMWAFLLVCASAPRYAMGLLNITQ